MKNRWLIPLVCELLIGCIFVTAAWFAPTIGPGAKILLTGIVACFTFLIAIVTIEGL